MEATADHTKTDEAKQSPPSFAKGGTDFFSTAGAASFFALPMVMRQRSGAPGIQRDDKKKENPVTGGLSTVLDNLGENNEKWKPFKDELKLKLWDRQPDEFKYGIVGFGLADAALLATVFGTDQLFRLKTINALEGVNIAAPLSLLPGSDYFILNSFKYKLPADKNGNYEFSGEFDVSPYMKLLFKDKTLAGVEPKFGLDLSYNPAGHSLSVSGFMFNISALNGAISLSGGVNQPLVNMPQLYAPVNPEDQPVWLGKEIPSTQPELKDNHFLFTVDVVKLFTKDTPKKEKKGEVQPQLTVNQPGDEYEQEADALADEVMLGGSGLAGAIQRKGISKDGDAMRQGAGDNNAAGDRLENELSGSKGGGFSLPAGMQAVMGAAFGVDFSSVRIHTDDQAVQMNNELRANAFTHGNDIYFNAGKYHPDSGTGKHLLAHELTHVVQQNGGGNTLQKDDTVDVDIVDVKPPVVNTVSGLVEDNMNIQEAILDNLGTALENFETVVNASSEKEAIPKKVGEIVLDEITKLVINEIIDKSLEEFKPVKKIIELGKSIIEGVEKENKRAEEAKQSNELAKFIVEERTNIRKMTDEIKINKVGTRQLAQARYDGTKDSGGKKAYFDFLAFQNSQLRNDIAGAFTPEALFAKISESWIMANVKGGSPSYIFIRLDKGWTIVKAYIHAPRGQRLAEQLLRSAGGNLDIWSMHVPMTVEFFPADLTWVTAQFDANGKSTEISTNIFGQKYLPEFLQNMKDKGIPKTKVLEGD